MPRLLTCPQGHQWDPHAKGLSGLIVEQGFCPECGGLPVPAPPPEGLETVPPRAESPTPPPADRGTPTAANWPAPGSEAGRTLPERFGRYRILKPLGKGGMGAVYLAHDTQLDRRVALKVPHFTPDAEPAIKERFFREARAAATLDHPNICPVYDVGLIDGVDYIAMAYIEGKPLSALIHSTSKPLPLRQVAGAVRKLASALEEAHKKKVIHRDLKPANIMVNRRGEPIIMDFGLAKRLVASDRTPSPAGSPPDADTELTRSGIIMGTPAYMPPEQANGELERIGPAADIYSLGVILFELLTKRVPFQGSAVEILAQLMLEEPKPPATFRPELDLRLQAICLKAMAKRIEDRYASMGELAAALTDFLRAGSPPPLAAATAPAPIPAGDDLFAALAAEQRLVALPTAKTAVGGRGRLWLWLVGGCAAAAFLIASLLYLTRDRDPERQALGPAPQPTIPAHPAPRGPSKEKPSLPAGLDRPNPPAPNTDAIRPPPTGAEKPTPSRPEESSKPKATPPAEPEMPENPAPNKPRERLAEPPEAEQKRARKKVLDVYQKGYAEAQRDRPALAKLAQELWDQGLDRKEEAAVRHACYVLARDWSLEAGRVSMPLRIAEDLAVDFLGPDLAKLRFDTLNRLSELLPRLQAKGEKVTVQWREVAEAALLFGEFAITDAAYERATLYLKLAAPAARLAASSPLTERLKAMEVELTALQKELRAVTLAENTLKTKPDDPTAKVILGKFWCFTKGDWRKGLPLLANGDDRRLRDLADRELARPAAPAALAALADGWWSLAEATKDRPRAPLYWHACEWYERALPRLKGLGRKQAEQRLSEKRTAPDFESCPRGFEEEFDNPKSGRTTGALRSGKVVCNLGYQNGKYTLQLPSGAGAFAYHVRGRHYRAFACEVVARVTGPPSDGWGLVLARADDHPDRGIQVRIDGEKRLEIRPAANPHLPSGSPPCLLLTPRDLKGHGEFNTLLVVVRGRRLEVYVNGQAVADPLLLDQEITPATLKLWIGARGEGAQVEFERLRVRDGAGLLPLEARTGGGK